MGMFKDAPDEIKAAMLALPIEAIHSVDEALMEGKLDPTFAATVSGLIEQIDATPWPEGLQAHMDEVRMTATELLAALEAGDATAASPLAADLHDMLHEMEMGVKEQ